MECNAFRSGYRLSDRIDCDCGGGWDCFGIQKDGGYGNKILLSHPGINGINTLYAHNSLLYVKEGDKVKKGQIIALSGNTGHTTGPHLHFEVRYQNVVLNPEHYLPVFQSSSEARVAIARETIEE